MKKKAVTLLVFTTLSMTSLSGCQFFIKRKNFDIKFVADVDNAVISEQTIQEGKEFTYPEVPTYTGYTFVEWTYEIQPVHDNLTVVARYEANKYTINLDYAHEGAENGTVSVKYNSTYTLPVAQWEGHEFKGWYDANGTQWANGVYKVAGDTSLTARWEGINFTITYVLDGGTNDSNNPAVVNANDIVNLKNATKTGYTFEGWYSDENFTEKVVVLNKVDKDLKLYAKFTVNKYKITLNYNHDGVANTSIDVEYNADYVLESPTWTGHKFLGWLDAAGKTWTSGKYNVAADTSLTASWDIEHYQINYHLNDGTNDIDNPTSMTFEDTFRLQDASKKGHTFGGWYSDANFTNRILILNNVTSNVDLYAKFTANTYQITLDFNHDDLPTQNMEVVFGQEFSLTDPTYDGHTFKGWKDDKNVTWKSGTYNLEGNLALTATWTAAEYSITYNLNGGTNNKNNPTLIKYEDNIILNDATKTGYTFDGWYSDANFTNKVSSLNKTTGNVELFAKFSPKQYKIELNYNHVGATNGSIDVYYDQNFTLEEPVWEGHKFKGWKDDSGSLWSSGVYKLEENLHLIAIWDIETYTITYHLDGGDNDNRNPNTITFNDSVALKDASKTGYVFDGWYLDANFENKVTTLNNVNSNIDLYAKFTANVYQITLDYNHDGIENDLVDVTYGSEFNLPTPTRTGYSFGGWKDAQGKTWTGGTYTLLDNLYLTASWSAETYKVTYHLDGGTNGINNPETLGYSDNIALEDASKVGYSFEGWYLDPNFTNRVTRLANISSDVELYAEFIANSYRIELDYAQDGVENEFVDVTYNSEFSLETPVRNGYTFKGWKDSKGNVWTSGTYSLLSDLKLTADWELQTYKVTYNLNGGTNNKNNPSSITYFDNVNLQAATKTGYTFNGWYSDPEFTDKVTSINEANADVVLYAKFTANPYRIELNYNHVGVANDIINVKFDENYELTDPVWEGHTFSGWIDDSGNIWTSGKYNVEGNTLLTASWDTVLYDIDYYLDGGTNSKNNPNSINSDETLVLSNPTKAGYSFDGWYSDPNFENKVEVLSNVTKNIELYAKFTLERYTITFVYGYNDLPNSYLDISYGHAYDFANLSREGYIFKGWVDAQGNVWTSGNFDLNDDLTLTASWEAISNKITYNLDGGVNNEENPSAISYGETITLKDPSKTGYTFDGWYLDEYFEEQVTSLTGLTSDVELYACFYPNTYRIILNYNHDGLEPLVIYVEYDNNYNVAATSWAGHTFGGWVDDKGNVWSRGIYTVDGDTTLTATWDSVYYGITYHLDGGTNNANNPNSISSDDSLLLKDASKKGHSFAGWYLDAELTNRVTTLSNVSGNVDLYAKYVANKYIITLVYGHDDLENDQIEVTYGQRYQLSNPTWAGHTFVDWKDAKGNVYAGGIYRNDGDITLTAVWESVTSTITYYLDGGTNSEDNISSISYDDTFVLEDATKAHYTFEGWYLDENFENKATTLQNISTDISLYAKFAINVYTITLNYNHDNLDNDLISISYGKPYNLESPIWLGHKFNGWKDEKGNVWTSGTFARDEDVSLTASWTLIDYTITYELDGGVNSEDNLETVNFDDAFDLGDASKAGYTFEGWYLDANFTNKVTSISDLTSDITLYAKFTANAYKITLKYNHGNIDDEIINISYDQAYSIPAASWEGHTFSGWIDEKGNIWSSGFYKVEGDTVLTASWDVVYYSITYNLDGGTNNENNPNSISSEGSVNLGDASKKGYSFAGWYLDAEFNDKVTTLSGITENVELFAKYTANTYVITLVYGHDNLENGQVEVTFGERYQLSDPTWTGHTFVDWKDEKGNVYAGGIYRLDSDLTLTAIWETNIVNINYHLNGGINNKNNPSSINYEDTLNLANATKAHYSFEGWFLDEDFETQVTTLSNLLDEIDLYAKFSLNVYSITLNYNHDNLDNESIDISYGDAYNLSSPTWAGHRFAGWKDVKGNVWSKGSYELDESITLTASWTLIDYSIIYDLDGGTNNKNNPDTVNFDQSVTLNAATKRGYTFDGWYSDAEFKNKVTSIANAIDDITLYAKFTANKYTVEFIYGYDNLPKDTLEVAYNSEYNFEDPIREGYRFTGWIDDLGNVWTNGTYTYESNLYLTASWELITSNITYHLDDGINNESNPDTISYFDYITLANPTKTGYRFDGWYLDADYQTKVTSLNKIDGDIDLYAKFSIFAYHINLDPNHDDLEESFVSVNYGGKYQLEDAVWAGHTFLGWYDDLGNKWTSGTYNLENDLDLTAAWESITYSISYYLDGGTNDKNNPSSITYEDNVTLKDATKSGFDFAGWYLDADFTTKVTTLSQTAGDVKLYAKFTTKAYKIYLDYNHDNESGSIDAYFNQAYQLPTPTWAGHRFVCWVDEYGDIYMDDVFTWEEDLSLIASWELVNFAIDYHLDGGTNDKSNPKMVNYDQEIVLKDASKAGYDFAGWYLDEEFETKVTTLSQVTGEVDLYAKFVAKSYKITLVYGHDNLENSTIDVTFGESYQIATPTWAGHTFAGWFDSKGNQWWRGTYEEEGDITLTASWDAIYYTITYHLDGGTNNKDNPNSISSEGSVTLKDASKTGYSFAGWYLDEDLTNKVTTLSGLSGNVDLYAKYTANTYVITLVYGHDNLEDGQIEVTYGERYQLSDPSWIGHNFLSWKDASGNVYASGIYRIADDLTLTANWEDITVSIVYHLDGGTNNANNSNSLAYSQTLVLADATKAHYTFEGWYLDEELTEKATSLTNLLKETHVYAKYSLNVYSITLNYNHDNLNSDTVPISYGEAYDLATPTWAGHKFNGWKDAKGNTWTSGTYALDEDAVLTASWSLIDYAINYHLDGGTNNEENPDTINCEQSATLKDPSKTGYYFDGWFLDEAFTKRITSLSNTSGEVDLYAKYTAKQYDIKFYVGEELVYTRKSSYDGLIVYESDYDYNPEGDFITWLVNGVAVDLSTYVVKGDTNLVAKYHENYMYLRTSSIEDGFEMRIGTNKAPIIGAEISITFANGVNVSAIDYDGGTIYNIVGNTLYLNVMFDGNNEEYFDFINLALRTELGAEDIIISYSLVCYQEIDGRIEIIQKDFLRF